VKGNIAWVVGGLAPIRRNWDGLLPVPGDGRYEWAGFWRGDQLPSVENPPSGFFSTANEMNLPHGYPVGERKLGFEWGNVSRHARIDSVLDKLPKVTLADSMRLQNDITSIPARRLVALLAHLKSDDAKANAALELLRGWDGVERADSPQAALMEIWISGHLGRAFLGAMLPDAAAQLIRSPDVGVMLDTLESRWSLYAKSVRLSDVGLPADRRALGAAGDGRWRMGQLESSKLPGAIGQS
jgi:penicillin amidase